MVVLVTRGDAAATDTTASLVPADALLYAHLSTSESRTQDSRLLAIAGRFSSPRFQLARLGTTFTPGAGGLDFARDVRPWLSDDAAIALLDGGGGRTEPLLVAAVRDRAPAEAMLSRLGASAAGTHNGVALRSLPPRATAAFAGDHLVVGPAGAVRGAIDRAAADDGGRAAALADGQAFRRAAEERTAASSVDVFASSAGLRRLLDGRDGIAGFAGRLLTGPRLEGVSAQVSAEESGLRIGARIMRTPGAPRPAGFTPSLTDRVPGDAAGFLALPGLDAAAELLSRTGGGGALLEDLRATVPQAAGLDLEDVLAPLADEAMLAVTSGDVTPVFTLTARTRDEAATREAMARLQGPLADRLAGGSVFEQRDVGGTAAFSLPVTPELEPSYALARGALVASSGRSGLGQLNPARTPITGNAALGEVLPEEGAKVEALGFFDSRQLLALGERTGLQAFSSPAVRDDLGRIRAAGAVVAEDAKNPTDTTVELFLETP